MNKLTVALLLAFSLVSCKKEVSTINMTKLEKVEIKGVNGTVYMNFKKNVADTKIICASNPIVVTSDKSYFIVPSCDIEYITPDAINNFGFELFVNGKETCFGFFDSRDITNGLNCNLIPYFTKYDKPQ